MDAGITPALPMTLTLTLTVKALALVLVFALTSESFTHSITGYTVERHVPCC